MDTAPTHESPPTAQLWAHLRQDRRYRDDGARRAMLTIFTFLGPEHELVQEHRRKLQLLL